MAPRRSIPRRKQPHRGLVLTKVWLPREVKAAFHAEARKVGASLSRHLAIKLGVNPDAAA